MRVKMIKYAERVPSFSQLHGVFSRCGWGSGLQIRVAVNILSKQLLTANNPITVENWHVMKCYTRPQTWRALVNMVINLRVPQNVDNFLTS
jgi:hypothetical protein